MTFWQRILFYLGLLEENPYESLVEEWEESTVPPTPPPICIHHREAMIWDEAQGEWECIECISQFPDAG